MRLLITFGPASEPLDGACRLTSMSTGRLGVHLADGLERWLAADLPFALSGFQSTTGAATELPASHPR